MDCSCELSSFRRSSAGHGVCTVSNWQATPAASAQLLIKPCLQAISTPHPPSLQLPQPMQVTIGKLHRCLLQACLACQTLLPKGVCSCLTDGRRQVVVVVDTNILVCAKGHLLMRHLEGWNLASDGQISLDVTILVPYIVLKVRCDQPPALQKCITMFANTCACRNWMA